MGSVKDLCVSSFQTFLCPAVEEIQEVQDNNLRPILPEFTPTTSVASPEWEGLTVDAASMVPRCHTMTPSNAHHLKPA
ncbi:unnamed protein product [Gadus morhua 'NCC']